MNYYDIINRSGNPELFDSSARNFKRKELKTELKHEDKKPSKSFDEYLKEAMDEC